MRCSLKAAGGQPTRGADERLPSTGVVAGRPEREDLSLPATGASSPEAGLDDARVIHNEEVAGREPSADLPKAGVGQAPSGAVEDEEPGCVARLRRDLGDGLGREVIVEVVDAQAELAHARHGNARPD